MTVLPMLVLAGLVLAVLAVAPLLWVAGRRPTARLDRRAAALVLHRDQLQELERDRAEGRISPAEHTTSVLEVQRRMLAADADGPAQEEERPSAGSRGVLWFVGAAVPVCAVGLYLLNGHPDLPGAPMAARMQAAQARNSETAGLLERLRAGVARLDPSTPQARQGYVLIGSLETDRGDYPAAAAAWKTALAAGFDPTLAARTAETLTAMAGHVTPEAAELFRRALAEAPTDVPWRPLAEARLATLH